MFANEHYTRSKNYFCIMNKKYLSILVVALLAVFVSVYSANKTTGTFSGSRKELLLRELGHELLRSSGDDSSRVMPIKEVAANEYRIIFENQLSLEPDSIITIVNRTVRKSNFPGNYSVNVIDCKTTENVYGFIRSVSGKDDIIACQGRSLPIGCYFINLKFSADNNNNSSRPTTLLLGGLALATLLLAGIHYYSKQKRTALAEESPSDGGSRSIAIGKYNFHAEQNYLELGAEKIPLTNKETKLLSLFAASINTVLDRDLLQKEVWENEGVIVTRSLDMFVSKLRKKLQDDPAVKIVNIPGKGYKLEVTA